VTAGASERQKGRLRGTKYERVAVGVPVVLYVTDWKAPQARPSRYGKPNAIGPSGDAPAIESAMRTDPIVHNDPVAGATHS
jgi:hypothetical protein